MGFGSILEQVKKYYSHKLAKHGATARGVDWNSTESQELRFEQLLKLCDASTSFSINDYGCGYGALASYMIDKGYTFLYTGFDISASMIAKAMKIHSGLSNCRLLADESLLTKTDYTVASGIFNVRFETSDEEWKEYVVRILKKIHELSEKGFAFNMLTKYSDPDRMRRDLYYADSTSMFDYCMTKFSRHVALLRDYGLYEFTLLVRK